MGEVSFSDSVRFNDYQANNDDLDTNNDLTFETQQPNALQFFNSPFTTQGDDNMGFTFAGFEGINTEPIVRNNLQTVAPQNETPFDVNTIQGVRGNPNVSQEFLSEVNAMAKRLGTRPEYLLGVMSFESGGSFSSSARNPVSGATGLIQFLPSTAEGLGTTTAALSRMTPVEQLRYVERYFQPFQGRLNTLEGVYTAVLSGSPRPNTDDVLFRQGTVAYTQNSGLDFNRDGQITSGEATSAVASRLFGGVTRVQQRLVDLGFVPQAQRDNFVDGDFGPNTSNALADFQRSVNLPATGLMNDATGRALFNLSSTEPVNPNPPTGDVKLKNGDRGAAVQELQNNLIRLGHITQEQVNTGPGIFGPRTETAVKDFQNANGLSPSGVFDNATRNAMNDIIAGVGRNQNANTNVTKALQDRLVQLGYMTRAQVNTGYGTFGPRTEAALKRFQADNGIEQTGVLGATTYNALQNIRGGGGDLSLSAAIPERSETPNRNITSPVLGEIVVTESFMEPGGPHGRKPQRYAIFSDNPNRIETLPAGQANVGIDYWVPDDRIRSWFNGQITNIVPESQSGGYGNMAVMQLDQTFRFNGRDYTVYAHYAHAEGFDVREGQRVTAGQVLGEQGTTGHSTGDHVDFQTWIVLDDGRKVHVSPNLLVNSR